MEIKSSDFHVDYSDLHRHWDPESEKYAGGDALITAIQSGWRLTEPIYEEKHWHAGTRLVTVYHAYLERGDEHMRMPVITNPFIWRGLKSRSLFIRPIEEMATRMDRTNEREEA